jgi:hypothetical protein
VIRFGAIVLAILAVIAVSSAGVAAQVKCRLLNVDGACIEATLRGQIVRGDYEKVVEAISKSWPGLTMLELHSPGGSAMEALKIGRLVRKYLITTNASGSADCKEGLTECGCASACALIWFGGIERMGTVGLHRPRIDDPEFAHSPPDEAMKRYRQVISAIEAYLMEMEAPRSIIDEMLATSSSDVRWVNAITSRLSRPPSYAEWEDASCHERFNPESGPFIDACRGQLRADRLKKLSPP